MGNIRAGICLVVLLCKYGNGWTMDSYFNDVVCSLVKEPGRCSNWTVRWYFDTESGRCERFWFGGCSDGNSNNFNNALECINSCNKAGYVNPTVASPDENTARSADVDSTLVKEPGRCSNWTVRWYFDTESGRCERFWFGGCDDGNSNNFDNELECRSSCDREDVVCSLAKDSGRCSNWTVRWYFDTESGRCERFWFGGCRDGNSNNFNNELDCRNSCDTTGLIGSTSFSKVAPPKENGIRPSAIADGGRLGTSPGTPSHIKVLEANPSAAVCGPAKVEGASCMSKMSKIGSTEVNVQRCQCQRGLIMNTYPHFSYSCQWDDEETKGVWKSISMTIEHSNVSLDDVRCLETCARSFAVPKNIHVQVHMNTDIQWYRSTPRPIFVGEELHFSCLSGYDHEPMYSDDYYAGFVMEGNFTESLFCLAGGKWDVPLDELNFDGCVAITCSASQYRNLPNGYIVNYRDTYRYLETVELRCDPGYKPRGRMSITCTHIGQFDVNDFACNDIHCPTPTNPLQGQVHYSGRSIGDNATFSCDKGTLYGKETWTCQENGQWDNECVVCVSDDDHCAPPCMTTHTMMTTYPLDFSVGSKLRFTCLGHTGIDTAIEKECLLNGMWTGNDLDCTGIKDFDIKKTWQSLSAAMDNIRKANGPQCPLLYLPVRGSAKYTGYMVGDTVTFSCDNGTLYGKRRWSCQQNGQWDGTCVICVMEDDQCPPPCLVEEGMFTTYKMDHSLQSTFEGNSCNRKSGGTSTMCSSDKAWSRKDTRCIGIKGLNPRDPLPQRTATDRNVPFYYHRYLYLSCGFIGVNRGTDVYFLLDVSGSVDRDMFDKTRKFIKTLLPHVGISEDVSGTRIAIFPFATNVFKYYDGTKDATAFKDYKEAQDMFDRLNRTVIAESTDTGTAIADALEEVYLSIATKVRYEYRYNNRKPDRAAVILISDGQYTTSGNPKRNADMIKKIRMISTEIYSIFIGRPEFKEGRRLMKEIASDIQNEVHFFAINSEDTDLSRVTRAMIGEGPEPLYCGKTDINNIGLRNGKVMGEQTANKTSWPWMVEILRKHQHICGGSIIDRRWVLTAAHCFDDGTDGIAIKFGSVKLNDLDADPRFIRGHEIFIHESYKQSTTRYAHDIALIKLRNPIDLHELVPVCYKPGDDGSKEVLFGPGRFGQALGWGSKDGWMDDILQQMQMQIQEDSDCPTEPAINSPDIVVFNSTYMFCAGGIDDMTRAVVDTHQGDSGGPLMMQFVNDPSRFRQVGIVSFRAPKRNKNVHYGFYTKLSTYIEWIDGKMKADVNQNMHR